VAYCSNWHVVCKDWWQGSSCTCGSSSYNYTSNYTSTYTTPTYTYTTPTYTYTTTPTYSYTYTPPKDTTTSTYTTTPTYTTSTYVNQYAYYDKQCQTQFWANSIASGTKYCVCKQWYTWSSDGKNCISEEKSCQEQFGKYATNSDRVWYCTCKAWYIRNDFDNKTKCISKQEYCKRFWNLAEATDDSSISPCQCKDWYEFNIDYTFNNNLEYCLPKEKNSVSWWTPDVLKIKQYLWDKAVMIESLAEWYKDKDKETQKKIKELMETFKASEDEYTRNIWIYLWFLIE